jgi:hypothetical protein
MSITILAEGVRTARKEYACAWCRERIQPGEQYAFSSLVDKPDPPYTWRLHKECRDAEWTADAHSCRLSDEYVCSEVDIDGGYHERGKNCRECSYTDTPDA